MANERAARGGGVVTPLQAQSMALTPYSVGGGGADWFGPGAPLAPLAPPEVAGRSWDFPSNYNIQTIKRPYQQITFAMLKALSTSYDVLRTIIETRKDQMGSQVPTVKPKDPKAKGDEPGIAERIAAAQKLIDEPYPGVDWDEWLRRMLEDLLVYDAPACFIHRNRGGGIYGIKPMDGSTFNRILDPWGDTPPAPSPAYVQILKGVGAVHYNREQLIYRPRNPRNGSAFGYGPVEQIVTIVNIAIRRETWQLNYFTEGNLPDALIGVPMEWTPDQIRNFQDWFDARLQGDMGRRRGATFVPGDVAKGYVATKDTELFGKAEEWMARVCCFAFSISPQPFVSQVNRATAGTAQEMAKEEGLEPTKKWVTGFWNYVFRTYYGWTDIVLDWEEEDDTDPKTLAETLGILVDKGIKSRNEARARLGDDPDAAPEANELTVTTASGLIPVSFDAQLDQTEQRQAMMPPPVAPGAPAGGGGQPRPKGGAGGSAASSRPAGGPGGGGKGGAQSKAAAPPLNGKRVLGPDVNRALARRNRATLKREVSAAFKTAADDVAGQVHKAMRDANKARAAKAVGDDEDPDTVDGSGSLSPISTLDAGALVDGLDLSSLESLYDVFDETIFDVAGDSAKLALAGVGVRDQADLVDRVNERAVDFSKDRAAELVGKRWTKDGRLIDNPNPKFAITQSTRDDLRALITKGLEDNIGEDAIAESIQSGFMFSAARAEMIAMTEIANANEQGKLNGWQTASSEAGVKMLKGWQTSNDEDEVCEVCEGNEDQGLIRLDDDFESGDDATPAHPRCQCVTYVEVADSGDQEDDNGGG